MSSRVAWGLSFGAVCILHAGACGSSNTCEAWEDCLDSEILQDLGRCTADFGCVQGACRASCTQGCVIVHDEVNPCQDGQLCTQGGSQKDGLCVSHPLPCENVADCPAFRPGDGLWSCESGSCRFPGYSYPMR